MWSAARGDTAEPLVGRDEYRNVPLLPEVVSQG